MRHGIPVIASMDDGGQEVNIDGVTGFNVARADKGRLTEVLVTLLRDRDYAQVLGSAGRARWEKQYTFGAFAERLSAATNAFLSNGKRA
jgi:phosphatidylinositol alpha-1,6-mannosyltransferase